MKKTFSIKKIAVIAAILMASVAGIIIFIYSQRLTATTMRLLKKQGIVKLYDKEKEKSIIDNIRLSSGNSIKTETESLAAIALDDSKVVTINDESRAQFEQKGKKLNIKLTDGSLFFEVSKKLASDETFDIRTSTMVVGIRGTSGYVAVDEEGHETLYITDGEVEVIGTNPTTGEQKVIRVKAGQRVRVYLYDERPVDSIMFSLEDVKEDDLQQAIKDRLIENEALMDKVCSATGWDKEKIFGIELIPEDVVPADAGDVVDEATEEDSSVAASSSDEAGEASSEEESAVVASTEEVTEDVEEAAAENTARATEQAEENTDAASTGSSTSEPQVAASTQATNEEEAMAEAYAQFQEDMARAEQAAAEQAAAEEQARLDQLAAQAAIDNANQNNDNNVSDTSGEPEKIDEWNEPENPDFGNNGGEPDGGDPNNGEPDGGDPDSGNDGGNNGGGTGG